MVSYPPPLYLMFLGYALIVVFVADICSHFSSIPFTIQHFFLLHVVVAAVVHYFVGFVAVANAAASVTGVRLVACAAAPTTAAALAAPPTVPAIRSPSAPPIVSMESHHNCSGGSRPG